MAFTKAQLEALKNSQLASAQPISAAIHRAFAQNIIDELYDAQSRGNLLSGVQTDGTTEVGDTILLIRGGQAYLVPASIFGGAGATLAGLGDVIIADPQDEDILTYDAVSGKWENIALTGLFVTQAQLDAALDALQLPTGARLIAAELIIDSDTAGTITAQWVDFDAETESVTAAALVFNTLPAAELPAPGNFRFDIVQGANAGTVSVKQGVEADAASVVIPTADAGNIVLAVVLWAEDGTAEVAPPTGNPQQNDWQLLRQSTKVAADTTSKFAKVWQGKLSKNGNFAIELSYAEPVNGVDFNGSGQQNLKVSFTCAAKDLVADTVKVETGPGSTAGEFVLYQIDANNAALYHKSNHYWGRIEYRVLFQNSQVRLQDFFSNSAYGSAPAAPVATFASVPAAGGGVQSVTGTGVDNTDPANPVLTAVYPAATHRENNTVLFSGDFITGIDAAARSGNILFDFTGAQLGAKTIMRHLDASAFTFPVQCYFLFDQNVVSSTLDNYYEFKIVDVTASGEKVEVKLLQIGGLKLALNKLLQEGATDGQVLAWSNANQKFQPTTPSGGGSSKWSDGTDFTQNFIYRDGPVVFGKTARTALNSSFEFKHYFNAAVKYFRIFDFNGNEHFSIEQAASADTALIRMPARYLYVGGPTTNLANGATFKGGANNAQDIFSVQNFAGTRWLRVQGDGIVKLDYHLFEVGAPTTNLATNGATFKANTTGNVNSIFRVLDSANNIRLELRGNGQILFPGIPTTSPGVTGSIWNDSGTLKIS